MAIGREKRTSVNKFKSNGKVEPESLDEEFADTYFGLMQLYKLLEVHHQDQPLFLARTLEYRREWSRTQAKSNDKKKPAYTSICAEAKFQHVRVDGIQQSGIVLHMTAMELVGSDRYKPVAVCTVKLPTAKPLILARTLLQPQSKKYVFLLQLAAIDSTMKTSVSFVRVSSPSVSKDNMLHAKVHNQPPLYSTLLSINCARLRSTTYHLKLTSLQSSGTEPTLHFALSWDLPRQQQRNRLSSIIQSKFGDPTAAEKELKPPRPTSTPLALQSHKSDSKKTEVWFHYLYHKMLRQVSEKGVDMSCPLCNLFCGTLRGLTYHLIASHSRLNFQISMRSDDIPNIYVMRQRELPNVPTTSAEPWELEFRGDKSSAQSEQPQLHLTNRKYAHLVGARRRVQEVEGMSEYEEMAELEDKPEVVEALRQRQYFHSRTGAVVLPSEKDYDSDDDVDEEWLVQQSEKLLDEFEDVTLEEKAFMKRWNRHLHQNKIMGDFMVASSCRLFAKENAHWLKEHNLRDNFLLHLLNLFDNSVINNRTILDCMLIVDNIDELPNGRSATD